MRDRSAALSPEPWRPSGRPAGPNGAGRPRLVEEPVDDRRELGPYEVLVREQEVEERVPFGHRRHHTDPRAQALTAVPIAILRGLASSRTGMRNVSTPAS